MTLPDLAVHLDREQFANQMAADIRAGLGSRPRTLPPKYFYDAHGSRLFDEITRLPEYYQTRTERTILEARVGEIARRTRAETLVELGSGTSEKTRLLLHALREAGSLRRFVPFDVDPVVLEEAAIALAAELPNLQITPVVGDFEHHLDTLPEGPRRLMVFLGSTIGNHDPDQRAAFLRDVRGVLREDDAFLLGTDLVKDPARLIAAYDDAQGVTAAFNKNVLAVLNRELHADFDPSAFDHVARWDARCEWIEMRLRSVRAQRVRVADLDLEVELEAGEEIRTEISAKFRRDRVTDELSAAGLRLEAWWTDPAGDYALSLARPV